MGVFLDVLENLISITRPIYFTQVLAIPTADDFIICCTRELFLNNLLGYFVLDILLVGKNAANGLAVNQHNVFNKDTFLHRFTLAYIFDILNGACLIFAVTGNVLKKFCFPLK